MKKTSEGSQGSYGPSGMAFNGCKPFRRAR
jgi:hypothetical protein